MRLMTLLIVTMLLASCADDIDASVHPPSTAVTISGTLPVMYIETENRTPITSKTEYLDAKYWLDPSQTAQLRSDRIKNALRKNIEWFNNHLPVSQHASSPQITGTANDEPVKVFNLQGICVGVYDNESQAQNNLDRGIYIINGKKIKIN